METLARGAADALGPAVRTDCGVTGLQVRRGCSDAPEPPTPGCRGFSLDCGAQLVDADAVVLAGPAHQSAQLIHHFAPIAAALLTGVHTAPLAVVCLGYDQQALTTDRGPLDGFGFLVPRGEGPRILGALWETSIYPYRAPLGKVLLRVMAGGATDLAAIDLADSDLLSIVRTDLEHTMRLRIAPEFLHIVRHWRGIPQYTIGHASRLERIATALAPYRGLFLAGNSYRGISINACTEDAHRVAADVAAHLRALTQPAGYRAAG
jgi:oxygen-dependent protoporphyrinogen oxidase